MNKVGLATGAGIAVAALLILWIGQQPDPPVDDMTAQEWLAYGIELYDQKQYAAALDDLARVPAGSPQKAQALYYEGTAHMMLKDYESATISLEQGLALNPQDTGTLYALGVTYYKLGNLAVAKWYFGAVLEINPNDEQAKGLMDIMAKLERESSVPAESE